MFLLVKDIMLNCIDERICLVVLYKYVPNVLFYSTDHDFFKCLIHKFQEETTEKNTKL